MFCIVITLSIDITNIITRCRTWCHIQRLHQNSIGTKFDDTDNVGKMMEYIYSHNGEAPQNRQWIGRSFNPIIFIIVVAIIVITIIAITVIIVRKQKEIKN